MSASSGLGRMRNPGPRGGNPTGLPMDRASVAARRARYAGFREDGLNQWQAATEVGVDPSSTGASYERWYQAGMAGGEQS